MASMRRVGLWLRCVLEAAIVLLYIFRVPYIVHVCRYKLHHESPSYNAQLLLGTALALGTVTLIAWDCLRIWRRLQRTNSVGLAK